MIIGHFAPALIPYHRLDHRVPIAWLLFCSAFNDFLFPILTLVGIEHAVPSSLFDASIQNLSIDTTYSHGPVFSLIYATILGLVTYLWLQDRRAALWCSALVVLHTLIDFVWGYDHFLWGPDSVLLSVGLFNRAPVFALFTELLVTMAIVGWYIRAEARSGRSLPKSRQWALISLFGFGVAFWFITATRSLAEWLVSFQN